MASSEEAWKTYAKLEAVQQQQAACIDAPCDPSRLCSSPGRLHSSVPVSGAYQQQPAPPRSVPVSGARQPATQRARRRQRGAASFEFFWDQLPTDALTMIIREAADMRLFAATSKAVRELAINSFYELEIGDNFNDGYERKFWPSGRWRAAPWVASNVSWPSSLKRVRINYRPLDALPRFFV